MNSTRRGFLSALTGMVAIPPWRVGRSELPPRVAHDTSPSTATVPAKSHRPLHQTPSSAHLPPRPHLALTTNHQPPTTNHQPPDAAEQELNSPLAELVREEDDKRRKQS